MGTQNMTYNMMMGVNLSDVPLSPVPLPPGTSSPPPGGPSTGWDKRQSSKKPLMLPTHTSAPVLKMLMSLPLLWEEVKKPLPSSDHALKVHPTLPDTEKIFDGTLSLHNI